MSLLPPQPARWPQPLTVLEELPPAPGWDPATWLLQDGQCHTTWSDGADALRTMIDTAVARGLRWIVISDHVRRDTRWVPDYVAAIEAERDRIAALGIDLTIEIGVEAKLLTPLGDVDAPPLPRGVDRVLIADHQWPTWDGPCSPRAMAERFAAAPDPAAARREALALLCSAIIGAVQSLTATGVAVTVAHPFSLLAKTGLTDHDIPRAWRTALLDCLATTGAILEVSEKWQTPSLEWVAAAVAAGVTVVPGSDAHRASDLGQWHWVRAQQQALVRLGSPAPLSSETGAEASCPR